MKNQLLDNLLKEQFNILEKYELIDETILYILKFNFQDDILRNSLIQMIDASIYEKYTNRYIELVYNELFQVEKRYTDLFGLTFKPNVVKQYIFENFKHKAEFLI